MPYMGAVMTKQEMIEVMDIYIMPLYQIFGGLLAIAMVAFAYWLVVYPVLKGKK